MNTIIIGGGISGLTALATLKDAGIRNILLFEKSNEVGGSMKTYKDRGFLSESGPNALQVTTPELADFVKQMVPNEKIFHANKNASKRFLVRNKKVIAAPNSLWTAINSPLLSFVAKLRVPKEFFISPAAPNTEEDLASFTKRRLGKEFLDYTINPMVGGVYAGKPDLLSVKYGFPKIYALEQNHGSLIRGAIAKLRENRKIRHKTHLLSFDGGMQTLAKSIADKFQKSINKNITVTEINKENDLWKVTTQAADGSMNIYYAKNVILACAVGHLAHIKMSPTIQNELSLLKEIPHPPVTSVTMGFSQSAIKHPLDGFGMLVPESEKLSILGTLFTSSLFPKRAPEGYVSLTTFIGGMRNPELASLSDESLKEIIIKDLDLLLGVTSHPVFTRAIRWKNAIPQYIVGYGKFLDTLNQIENKNPGLYFIGQYREGISVSYCIQNAQRRMKMLISKQQ